MKFHPTSRPVLTRGFRAAALLTLSSIALLPLHGANISWSSTAGSTTWSTGTNWNGGTAPADDYTTDIAVFNQTSYANQPNLTANRSVNGLIFGDGSTSTASTTIGGSVLRIGTGGIVKQVNSGAFTFANSLRLNTGAQSWTNNSSSNITAGTVGTALTVGSATGTTAWTFDGSGAGDTIIHNLIASTTGGVTGITVARTGSGNVTFTNANTYTGGTAVSSGVLLVNNSTGSGTGSGAVTLASSGTLGGAGFIGGATTANSGSLLAPGSASGAAGTLTFNSTLNISGLASGAGGLLFDLGATAASDKISSSSTLTIGSGVLDLGDFNFATLSGFDTGTYTLLHSNTSIVGTLGSNLTGTVGGLDAALSLSGSDIILTVTSAIPEPSTYAALIGALALGAAVLRRRLRFR